MLIMKPDPNMTCRVNSDPDTYPFKFRIRQTKSGSSALTIIDQYSRHINVLNRISNSSHHQHPDKDINKRDEGT